MIKIPLKKASTYSNTCEHRYICPRLPAPIFLHWGEKEGSIRSENRTLSLAIIYPLDEVLSVLGWPATRFRAFFFFSNPTPLVRLYYSSRESLREFSLSLSFFRHLGSSSEEESRPGIAKQGSIEAIDRGLVVVEAAIYREIGARVPGTRS